MACSIAQSHHKVTKKIHQKLIGTAAFCSAVTAICTKSQNNQHLNTSSLTQEAHKNLTKASTKPPLLDTLNGATFTNEPSIFSLQGKVLATFPQMQQNCDNFIDLMVFAGRMDALLSIAKYCKSLPKNSYCFVDYAATDKPHLAISGLWHPMLNRETAVQNDICLSGKERGPQHMIITGPNAGGKSTFLRQVIIAVIMAQSFGIANAQHMTLSPFTIIETYLNIADSTGHMSLFQAEADRMANIQHHLSSRPDQLSIGIYDEMYTGVDDETAIKEATIDINKLCAMPHNIMLMATHHHPIAYHFERIKQHKRIANYKVSVQEKVDQGEPSYKSTFKITPGISTQKIGSFVCKEARKRYNVT